MANADRIVYCVSPAGHRGSYVNLLSNLFSFEPLVAPMSTTVQRRLIGAAQVLFATLDDDMAGFSRVAVARSIRRRRTTALFLRAQKCFESDRWYYTVKRRFFSAMRTLPGLTIATISPFDVAPQYSKVANVGVCDPQYWDLCDGKQIASFCETLLSQQIRTQAVGRKICCALGSIGPEKGHGFLADMLSQTSDIKERFLFVCAGKTSENNAELLKHLRSSGAMVIDRLLTDAELTSLYGIADVIWACYAPLYDQASGIFGRAVQYGVLPIVREHSILYEFALHYGISIIPLRFGDTTAALKNIDALALKTRCDSGGRERRLALVKGWRQNFIRTVGEALTGTVSPNRYFDMQEDL